MGFSVETAKAALVACGRRCCLCAEFCGTKIQTHHIVPEGQGGSNEFDNCMPLCLDCHAEVDSYNPRHPIGRKFSRAELIGHRDRLYEQVRSGVLPRPISDADLDSDRKTLAEITQSLPSDGAIQWVRGLEFMWCFSTRGLPPLLAFAHEYSGRPDKEFLDRELEARRMQLLSAVFELNSAIMNFTTPARGALPGNDGIRECPPFPRMGDPRSALVERAFSKLNSSRERVVSSYDELIRAARRRLAT
jgi:hypothetical protein